MATAIAMETTVRRTSPLKTRANLDETSLIAAIHAVLDQPQRSFFDPASLAGCECAGCEAIRARGIVCKACGYRGAPIVEACDCKGHRDEIPVYERMVREIEENGVTSDGEYTIACLEPMRIELTRFRALPDLCQPFARLEDRKKHGNAMCSHGGTWCPTCMACDGESSAHIETEDQLAARIREVRKLLARH